MHLKTLIHVLLAIGLVQFLHVPATSACQCLPREGTIEDAVAEAFEMADEVFLGEITDSELVDVAVSDEIAVTLRRVTFLVLQSWKGTAASSLVVDMPENEGQCGPGEIDETGRPRDPVVGDRFLVYAQSMTQSTVLMTNLCRRTAALCSGSGLEDIEVFSQIGIHGLLSNGLMLAELGQFCDSDLCPNETGCCGIGVLCLCPLLTLALLCSAHYTGQSSHWLFKKFVRRKCVYSLIEN